MEHRAEENNQNEPSKIQKVTDTEDTLMSNIHVIRVPERKTKRTGGKAIFEGAADEVYKANNDGSKKSYHLMQCFFKNQQIAGSYQNCRKPWSKRKL